MTILFKIWALLKGLFKKNSGTIGLIGIILGGVIALSAVLSNSIAENKVKNRLLFDIIQIEKLKQKTEDEYKKEFVNKCLLARQVYQFSWYSKTPTKIGDLQLEKYYAMTLREYNALVERAWEYNRLLGIPLDSWENYIMLGKWIMESAICPFVEHKTGEILKFAGYTEIGLRDAMFIYLYQSHIERGHPLYIEELFKPNNSLEDLKHIFNNPITGVWNTEKFDYAFILYLLSQYNYDWAFTLTGFHYGYDTTDYWKSIGLKEVPVKRLDGGWGEEFLRDYYQAILEIAQGIKLGRLERISQFEQVIGYYQRMDKKRQNFIDTLRLKVRSEQQFKNLTDKYYDLKEDFTNYKKLNDSLLKSMADLNDLTLEKENPSFKERIQKLKNTVTYKYKQLLKEPK